MDSQKYWEGRLRALQTKVLPEQTGANAYKILVTTITIISLIHSGG